MSAPSPEPSQPLSNALAPLLVDMDPLRLVACNMALSLKNAELRRDLAQLHRRVRELEDALAKPSNA